MALCLKGWQNDNKWMGIAIQEWKLNCNGTGRYVPRSVYHADFCITSIIWKPLYEYRHLLGYVCTSCKLQANFSFKIE
jgi:hypothetical protein